MLSRIAQYHTVKRSVYHAAMETETFQERLKRLRESANLSAGALALRVGVTEGAIRQMESGQTKSASFVVGVRLSNALGVTPHYLATGTEMQLGLPEEMEQFSDGGRLSIRLKPGCLAYGGDFEDLVASLAQSLHNAGVTVTPPAASDEKGSRRLTAAQTTDVLEQLRKLSGRVAKLERREPPGGRAS